LELNVQYLATLSAIALIVRSGFTPRLVGTNEPSQTSKLGYTFVPEVPENTNPSEFVTPETAASLITPALVAFRNKQRKKRFK
jgi:hypothetical protein